MFLSELIQICNLFIHVDETLLYVPQCGWAGLMTFDNRILCGPYFSKSMLFTLPNVNTSLSKHIYHVRLLILFTPRLYIRLPSSVTLRFARET